MSDRDEALAAFQRIRSLAERRLRPHHSDIDTVTRFMQGHADTEKRKTTRSKLNQLRYALRHVDDAAMRPETKALLLEMVDNILEGS